MPTHTLHLIEQDLAVPGWLQWDWTLFVRWLNAWRPA